MEERLYMPSKEDLEILMSVNNFRFLPLKVLSKLLIEMGYYTRYQAVSRAIKRLKGNGYLRSINYGGNAKVLFLSRKGSKLLAFHYQIDRGSINCPERLTGVNYFSLEHTLKVADLYNLILSEAQKFKFQLKDFKGDHSIKFEYEFKAYVSGRNIKRCVMPDAMFYLQRGEHKRLFFIEYDRGTECHKDVANKYMKYFQYFLDGYWADRFDDFPIILFISESSGKRLLNLIPREKLPNSFYGSSPDRDLNNVVLRGVLMHENIRSCGQHKVNDFLKNKFLFVQADNLYKNGFMCEVYDHNQNTHILNDCF